MVNQISLTFSIFNCSVILLCLLSIIHGSISAKSDPRTEVALMLDNSFLSMFQAREVSIAVQGKMVEQQRTKGKGPLRESLYFVPLFSIFHFMESI